MTDLTTMVDMIDRALSRSSADPVRVDRRALTALRNLLVAQEWLSGELGDSLTPIERAMLGALIEANGQVVSYQALADHTRGGNIESMWVHIHRLREKLAAACRPEYIDTVRGQGYLLRSEEVVDG